MEWQAGVLTTTQEETADGHSITKNFILKFLVLHTAV